MTSYTVVATQNYRYSICTTESKVYRPGTQEQVVVLNMAYTICQLTHGMVLPLAVPIHAIPVTEFTPCCELLSFLSDPY